MSQEPAIKALNYVLRLARTEAEARAIVNVLIDTNWSSIYKSVEASAPQREARKNERRRKPTPERIQALRAMPYREYLQTQEWKTTRYAAYNRAGKRCQACNTDK